MGTISNGTVSIILLGVSYSIVLPLLLCVIFKKRFKAHLKPFFLGMLAYAAFSFCLVNLVNGLLLMFVDTSGFSSGMIFVYSLCTQTIGALLAQSGKYYTIRILKNDPNPNKYAMRGDALELGTGFGGLEAIMTIGITMASYFSYAALIMQSESVQTVLDSFTGEDKAGVQEIINLLTTSSTMDFLAINIQGLAMIIFQIGSTLLVFRAVFGENDKAYFRLALIFHIIMIIPGCILNAGIIKNVWFETITMLVFSVAVLVYSYDKIKEYEKRHVKDMIGKSKGKKTIHLK